MRKINGILKMEQGIEGALVTSGLDPFGAGSFQGPKGPHMWSHRVSCSSTVRFPTRNRLFVWKGCWEHVAYHPAISFQQVNNFATYSVVIILLISKTQEFQIYFSDIFTIFHPKNLEKKSATEWWSSALNQLSKAKLRGNDHLLSSKSFDHQLSTVKM